MSRKKVSQTQISRIGRLAIYRGKDEEDQLVSWDYIDDCRHEECPAYVHCPYEQNNAKRKEGKCGIMGSYLRSATKVLFESQKSLSSAQKYQIGMHLMPMYRMLCRLNIEEIGVLRAVSVDEKGIARANPIYREIRDTIKTIDMIWRSLGIREIATPKPLVPGMSFGEDSDVSYYDAMEKEALKEMKK